MENVIVATFSDETKAVEELYKLNKFDSEGAINIFNHVMIGRNSNGIYEVSKDDKSDDWKTLVGMTVGELAEQFGGAVGFVVGLYTKAAVEAAGDIGHFAFAQDFIDGIGKDIPIGTTALIAQVDKKSASFIDNYLQPLGSVILQSTVFAEKERFEEKHIHALDTKIENAEGKLEKAAETEKEKISFEIAKLKNKRESGIARIKYQNEKRLLEFQGKLESNRRKLQKQISKLETAVSEKKDDDGNKRTEKEFGKYQNKIVKYEGKIAELKGRMKEFYFASAG
jgi:uncharacterized membrane protein